MIKPCSTNILLRVLDEPSESPGGILIPETLRNQRSKAEVLAIGPKVKELRPFDIVSIPWYGGDRLEGKQLLLREEEIYGVFTKTT